MLQIDNDENDDMWPELYVLLGLRCNFLAEIDFYLVTASIELVEL